VMQYREDGFLPEALLNYLVRLGWSHGDQEIFSLDEMIEYFEIKDINRAAASFNPEKLLWLNQHYIRTLDPSRVASELAWHMAQQGIDPKQGPALTDLLQAQGDRCKTLKEMAEKSRYFYTDSVVCPPDLASKHLTQEARSHLAALRDRFAALPEWRAEAIHQAVNDVAEGLGLKLGKIAQPLRVAVTGGTVSPPIDATLKLLGPARTLARLDALTASN
jgi:glutamyl-tRNA synthetase